MIDIYDKMKKAEATINNIWPYVTELSAAQCELEEKEGEYSYCNSNYIPGVWMLRICVPIAIICALLFFLLPQNRTIFGDYQRGTGAIIAAMIGSLAAFLVFPGLVLVGYYGAKRRKAKTAINSAKERLKEAQAKFEKMRDDNIDSLSKALEIVPADAFDPKHARMLTSYFETGRAHTLPEALNLIEEQIHRERMENLHQENLSAVENLTNLIRNKVY